MDTKALGVYIAMAIITGILTAITYCMSKSKNESVSVHELESWRKAYSVSSFLFCMVLMAALLHFFMHQMNADVGADMFVPNILTGKR